MVYNERSPMKKMMTILTLAALLAAFPPILAAETRSVPATSGLLAPQEPKETIFNHLSDFFSGFDKTYARRGNKQGFWAATADWMRNINK